MLVLLFVSGFFWWRSFSLSFSRLIDHSNFQLNELFAFTLFFLPYLSPGLKYLLWSIENTLLYILILQQQNLQIFL